MKQKLPSCPVKISLFELVLLIALVALAVFLSLYHRKPPQRFSLAGPPPLVETFAPRPDLLQRQA
ncbi:MAG: hypothetical protein KQJ78_22800 [Deltaproteobacteria bacterium]|nr:hypothetical protein [Deltaproteobacteria bacterium]